MELVIVGPDGPPGPHRRRTPEGYSIISQHFGRKQHDYCCLIIYVTFLYHLIVLLHLRLDMHDRKVKVHTIEGRFQYFACARTYED